MLLGNCLNFSLESTPNGFFSIPSGEKKLVIVKLMLSLHSTNVRIQAVRKRDVSEQPVELLSVEALLLAQNSAPGCHFYPS